MPKYIAFLRAINVGGHSVSMPRLRELFEALGLGSVETFIASGNVVFASGARQPARLERQIEQHLEAGLGYPVATFIRTPAEVRAVADTQPFAHAAATDTLYVAFLPAAPSAEQRALVLAQQTPVDSFHFAGRELYWLRQGESAFSGARLEKLLGGPATVRNANTVRRLAQKVAGEEAAGG
jgi:uncharacterized protein (DUF1697 family)